MLFSKETLRSFANSKGITSVDDDALRILSQDLEYRLKEVCQRAGMFMLASHSTKLTVDNVNNALKSKNIEPLFGYDSDESLVFRGLPSNVYYVPDEEIDIEAYLDRPLPKVPLKPYFQSHWLAIEGVQPPIKQNPILTDENEVKNETLTKYQESLELKQQNKHLLTKELSMYFDKILETIETETEIALECLKNESGIQQLVPYFIHHFNTEIRAKISNEDVVERYLMMYLSLFKNKYIFIDPYLSEILPVLISCVVGKSVNLRIRKLSSDIVKIIYDNHGSQYKRLIPKILNTLRNAWLDSTKSEDSQFGAVLCLSQLSKDIFEDQILNNLEKDSKKYSKVVNLIESKRNKF